MENEQKTDPLSLLIEGARELVTLVPNLRGYKLRKSTADKPNFLRHYIRLIPDSQKAQAFYQKYGDLELPFSIDITNDGYLFRVLPKTTFFVEAGKRNIKLAAALETHPNLLFRANDEFIRKQFPTLESLGQPETIADEAHKVHFLLPGYTGLVKPPYPLASTQSEEPGSAQPLNFLHKPSYKIKILMPKAQGDELLSYALAFQSKLHQRYAQPARTTNATLTDPLVNNLRLCITTLLMTLENFRLQNNLNLVHCDLKLENIFLHIDTTQTPTQFFAYFVDAESVKPSGTPEKKLFGTPGFIPAEVYDSYGSAQTMTTSPKQDVFALGVAILIVCFTNFFQYVTPRRQGLSTADKVYCARADQFRFDDHDELFYKGKWLQPIMEPTPSFCSAIKAIIRMTTTNPEDRPLAIDLLQTEFVEEMTQLAETQPHLKNSLVYQTFLDQFVENSLETEVKSPSL